MPPTSEVHADGWCVRLDLGRQVLRLEVPEAVIDWHRGGRKAAGPPLLARPSPRGRRSRVGRDAAAEGQAVRRRPVRGGRAGRPARGRALRRQGDAPPLAGRDAGRRAARHGWRPPRRSTRPASWAACRSPSPSPSPRPSARPGPTSSATKLRLQAARLLHLDARAVGDLPPGPLPPAAPRPGTADDLARALERTPGAADAYDACLRLNARLTNPPRNAGPAGRRETPALLPALPLARGHAVRAAVRGPARPRGLRPDGRS